MPPLKEQACRHVSGAPLQDAEMAPLLAEVPLWEVGEGALQREFRFDDFHRTMAFVNLLAWVAHQQDHHPDVHFGYNRCTVRWSTHSVGGLSLNDFICAARLDALAG